MFTFVRKAPLCIQWRQRFSDQFSILPTFLAFSLALRVNNIASREHGSVAVVDIILMFLFTWIFLLCSLWCKHCVLACFKSSLDIIGLDLGHMWVYPHEALIYSRGYGAHNTLCWYLLVQRELCMCSAVKFCTHWYWCWKLKLLKLLRVCWGCWSCCVGRWEVSVPEQVLCWVLRRWHSRSRRMKQVMVSDLPTIITSHGNSGAKWPWKEKTCGKL